jgi:hypothetical protein
MQHPSAPRDSVFLSFLLTPPKREQSIEEKRTVDTASATKTLRGLHDCRTATKRGAWGAYMRAHGARAGHQVRDEACWVPMCRVVVRGGARF